MEKKKENKWDKFRQFFRKWYDFMWIQVWLQKQKFKVSQKTMSGNVFVMQNILNVCLNFWRQSHTTKLQYNLSMKEIFWFFQETCKTILFPIFLRFHRGRNSFYLPNRRRLQDNVMREHVSVVFMFHDVLIIMFCWY